MPPSSEPPARRVDHFNVFSVISHDPLYGDGQPPRQFFEMNLTRLGDTDWPAGGAVAAK